MRGIVFVVLCVVSLYMKNTLSLQVIPERIKLTSINEKYAYKNVTLHVKRYGRKSLYYVNIGGTTKTTFENNVSVHFIFYEYLHNEYKRSFVEMHFHKLCDMYNSDPYIGRALRMTNFMCPLPPGNYRFVNITVPTENFPNVWPFERCKAEASLVQMPTRDLIASADIYVLFKQKLQRG